MEFLALTDHDTTAGIKDFLVACEKHKILGFVGVEISTEYQSHEYHILGYNIDIKNKALLEILKKQKEVRKTRAKKTIKKFQKLGFEINKQFAKKILKNESVGKPHIRNLILSKKKNLKMLREKYGFDPKTGDFIDLFLSKPKQIGFVKKTKIPTKQAIAAIKKAGGMAVLAHPALEFKNKSEFQKTAALFQKWGMKGIETFYPYKDKNKIKIKDILNFCQARKLLATAGSDFHKTQTKYQLGKTAITKKQEELLIKNFDNKLT